MADICDKCHFTDTEIHAHTLSFPSPWGMYQDPISMLSLDLLKLDRETYRNMPRHSRLRVFQDGWYVSNIVQGISATWTKSSEHKPSGPQERFVLSELGRNRPMETNQFTFNPNDQLKGVFSKRPETDVDAFSQQLKASQFSFQFSPFMIKPQVLT